jgi:hypothetical protein
MRPYQHSISSCRLGPNDWEHDLPIHEFMDSTKFSCADRRHRVVLHHSDLGGSITARAFPDRTNVRQKVDQHIAEDLGQVVTLADWFRYCQADLMPKPVARRVKDGAAGVAEYVAGRMADTARPAIEAVCSFLFEPLKYLDEDRQCALPLLMNSAGPMIVRRVFGPAKRVSGGGIVDFAWIAEAAIYTAFGRIPDLGEIVRCWVAEPTGPQVETA